MQGVVRVLRVLTRWRGETTTPRLTSPVGEPPMANEQPIGDPPLERAVQIPLYLEP